MDRRDRRDQQGGISPERSNPTADAQPVDPAFDRLDGAGPPCPAARRRRAAIAQSGRTGRAGRARTVSPPCEPTRSATMPRRRPQHDAARPQHRPAGDEQPGLELRGRVRFRALPVPSSRHPAATGAGGGILPQAADAVEPVAHTLVGPRPRALAAHRAAPPAARPTARSPGLLEDDGGPQASTSFRRERRLIGACCGAQASSKMRPVPASRVMPIRWWPVGSSMPIHSANAAWQPLMIVVSRLFMSGWLVVDRRLERVTGIEPALSALVDKDAPGLHTAGTDRRHGPTAEENAGGETDEARARRSGGGGRAVWAGGRGRRGP